MVISCSRIALHVIGEPDVVSVVEGAPDTVEVIIHTPEDTKEPALRYLVQIGYRGGIPSVELSFVQDDFRFRIRLDQVQSEERAGIVGRSAEVSEKLVELFTAPDPAAFVEVFGADCFDPEAGVVGVSDDIEA